MSPQLIPTIEVRRMRFDVPERIDPSTITGKPTSSHLLVGLSLLFAYLEPYLVRTMQAAKSHVTDPALRDAMTQFSGQEGQHFRAHMRYNEAIRRAMLNTGQHAAHAELYELEQEYERDYRRYSDTRSLRFNLAYAEGFEAFTSAFAMFALEVQLDALLHPASRDLFRWHLVEELEHRLVAFDVYDHLHGDYLYRLGVGLYAQCHLLQFVVRAMSVLARGQSARAIQPLFEERPSFSRLAVRHFLPKLLATYTPWYTPHAVVLPPDATALALHYSELARAAGA